MKTVNEVRLMGYVGTDPESRYTTDGKVVASFPLGTNYIMRDQDGHAIKDSNGQYARHTDWHDLVAFGRLAEGVKSNVHKGTAVWVSGRLHRRVWQDKEKPDQKRSRVEVVMYDFILLPSVPKEAQRKADVEEPPVAERAPEIEIAAVPGDEGREET